MWSQKFPKIEQKLFSGCLNVVSNLSKGQKVDWDWWVDRSQSLFYCVPQEISQSSWLDKLMGWMVIVGQCSFKSTFGANKSQESESRSLSKQNPYSCLLFVLCHPILETDSGKSWQQCVAIFCEVNFKLASSTPCCSPVVYVLYTS